MTISLTLLPTVLSTSAPPVFPAPGPSKESSPNPIASLYPNSVTGTINGTFAAVPIPFEMARNIIPSQYGILKAAYKSLLPGFPEGKYPVSFFFVSVFVWIEVDEKRRERC
jgi:hypothetical protein